MTPASINSFFRTPIQAGNRIQINCALGKFMAKDTTEADGKCAELLGIMEQKLGRWPSDEEVRSGPVLKDDRTLEQKYARDEFRPEVDDDRHPMEKLAESLAEDAKDHMMLGKTLKERLAADAMDMVECDSEEAIAAKIEAERLAKLQPKVSKLKDLAEQERWNPNGSQLFLDRLEMAIEQIEIPNADPEAVAARLGGIKVMLDDRAKAKRARIEAEVASHQARLEAIEDGTFFEEPTADE